MAEEVNNLVPEDPGEGSRQRHQRQQKERHRQALQGITRELSDEDFASPVVQKFLLDEIERLDIENHELNKYRDQFHVKNKKVAVLEEKIKTNIAFEVISIACLTIGAAAVGYAPAQPDNGIILALGIILILGGIAAKVRRW